MKSALLVSEGQTKRGIRSRILDVMEGPADRMGILVVVVQPG